MKSINAIVATPLLSEKALARRGSANQYLFRVAPAANKAEIKKAVEERFQVKVVSVNTLNAPSKIKQVRGVMGRRSAWKKAVVRLQQGDVIKELE